jgi:hypothetical protein
MRLPNNHQKTIKITDSSESTITKRYIGKTINEQVEKKQRVGEQ